MSHQIDSAIKLFGWTIPLTRVSSDHDTASTSATVSLDHNPLSDEGTRVNVSGKQDKGSPQEEATEENHEGGTSNQILEDSKDPTTSCGISENPKTSSADRETASHKSCKKGELSETSSSQEKALKKPDKILPCPRCNSMDTKFCYYNNYNVNQPRHFCRNCQRYWTAGGSMRNMAVGAGRRKSKTSSSSNHHDITVSEALLAAQASAANGVVYGGHILTFGSHSPLCESVASVLNLQQKTQGCVRNGIHRPEQRKVTSTSDGGQIGDDQTSGTSFTASNILNEGGNTGTGAATEHFPAFPQVCFSSGPWPYPCNSALPLPPPAFCPQGFPVSFCPVPTYWGYNTATPWNASSPPSVNLQTSSPTSPTLGKHSRDENSWSLSNSDKEQSSRQTNHSVRRVLVPKTLRIDDPDEAARSSIWATLGIKSDKTTSISTGSLFNGFQLKRSQRNHRTEATSVQQANPAALSRSVKFHEST